MITPVGLHWHGAGGRVSLGSNKMPTDSDADRDPNAGKTADDDAVVGANPGYALGQVALALSASQVHEDPELRERARARAQTWTQVFEGMLSGTLAVGSRTPVPATPGWATLKVVTGGFATGDLLAGGVLLVHEHQLLGELGLPPDDSGRASLNAYYLSDAGLARLRDLLGSGQYRVQVPEEGALLVVAWLLQNGHVDQARVVLDEIAPWLGRLRFYPAPHARPLGATSAVHVKTVGEVLKDIARIREPWAVIAERETLSIWAPLFDRMLSLFLDTVEGPIPSVATGPEGRPVRRADGSWTLSGGWPCQRYPEGWRERAKAWLAEYRRLRAVHRRCRRPELPRKNFGQLLRNLEHCTADPRSLSGRDVGTIRMILAQVVATRGLPDSPQCVALRQAQAHQATQPTKHELAQVIAHRLRPRQSDAPLDALEPILAATTADEATRFSLPSGSSMPLALRSLLTRCLEAPVDLLIEEGAVPSGEVLARVIAQLTSRISASGFEDADLGRLHGAIYEAFRRRRSLLLLNLEKQIRIDELPWVVVMAGFRSDQADTRLAARALLDHLAILALTAFPHAILPNKLLQEIRLLAERAAVVLPIVDEVAADIFMGEFTEKYLHAAQWAGRLLAGSLYERYYGISYDDVRRIDDVDRPRRGAPTSRRFLELCSGRVADPGKTGWVARNGAIIEQEQILTTHNLAVLVHGLGLRSALEPRLFELAQRCFVWICWRQQLKSSDWRSRLHMIKNTAYAWRQMVFFLSLASKAVTEEFLAWAESHFSAQRQAFQSRFRPALTGLALAAEGRSLDATPNDPKARQFLGWAPGDHWLMGS
jgi:hypothetical protein